MTLLARLFGAPTPARQPQLPAGYVLYAIGDVHGRDDLLGELLARIEEDLAGRAPAKRIIVFLGDLIDRGPSSAQVVERLQAYKPERTRLVFLAGNHEEVLLRILGGEVQLVPDWLRFGGAECLRSYGTDPDRLRKMAPARALEAIRSAFPHPCRIPARLRRHLPRRRLSVRARGRSAGHPLAEQAPADLRWIREPFLTDGSEHGFLVVHGHTIREQVDERANRVGIDTGAYRYGILTALGLAGGKRWYLQAGKPKGGIRRGSREPRSSSALDAVSSQSG